MAAQPDQPTLPAHSSTSKQLQPWSERRVASELERFLATREGDYWPTYAEFCAAGRKRLAAAVAARGGPERWALELGLTYQPRPGRPSWDERRIRRELRLALTALSPLTTWPTMTQIAAVSSWALVGAIKRTGGQGRWAQEFGVPIESWRARSLRRPGVRVDGS